MTVEAVLVLENGAVFRGTTSRDFSDRAGEVVFNTSMTGYQEVVTDPSYAGQIVVMTAPQIGNVGVNSEDSESRRPSCIGFVVRDLSPLASNWRSEGELPEFLADHGIVAIDGVDTRALTRALRAGGAMRGVLSTAVSDVERLAGVARNALTMEGQNLVPRVTCAQRHEWVDGFRFGSLNESGPPAAECRVIAYDFGAKSGVLRHLRDGGCGITVVPSGTSAQDALAMGCDGIFLSNGPGDPAAASEQIEIVAELVESGLPIFGICLGHQILSLALGATTFKLPFGHHGGNHPVLDLATGKVEITAQNHGFAVREDSLPTRCVVTHRNLNDGTVEGIALRDRPVFGIQYHPEACPGPHDSTHLFARFVDAMKENATRKP